MTSNYNFFQEICDVIEGKKQPTNHAEQLQVTLNKLNRICKLNN